MEKRIINDEFISRLETLALDMKAAMQGYFGGNHKTNTYGSTVEFADFREYVLGDDIRRIDWNLYSRFEKHFIKLYVDERQMHNQIFIDCSASMSKINSDKALYALKVAAALGFLSVHNMDKTSYHLIKGNYAENMSGLIIGKDTFFHAVGQLEKTEFSGTANIANAIINSETGSNDGMTIIISDFLTESDWKKAVNYLKYKKRQAMLIQVLAPEEINPNFNGRTLFLDAESTDPLDERNMKLKINKANLLAYKQALEDYQQDLKSYCIARGANFYSARCDEKVEKLIFGNLYKMGSVK